MKTLKKTFAAIAFLISLLGTTGCEPPNHLGIGIQYSNPIWAPPYYSGVRYYYLPDIEVYYDLSGQDFIYLDNAQWIFSPVLPSIYRGYDLDNGFVIALNTGVYQPWLHHQYYVSHYPRYYYHNYYKPAERPTIRGFNENERRPILWRTDDRNRRVDLRTFEKKDIKIQPNRTPQPTNYYGKNIGLPVKVRSIMKEKVQAKPAGVRRF